MRRFRFGSISGPGGAVNDFLVIDRLLLYGVLQSEHGGNQG
ncbi:uncharacterized protein METZ01_LOCUS142903, partial [marine metagenome]